MLLRTEFRVFVDMDDCKVIGISPYWEPETMKKRLGHQDDRNSLHKIHEYIIYHIHEEKLKNEYEQYKDIICKKIEEMLPDIDLTGEWSIDIVKNGDDFYIIDMALAQNSTLMNVYQKIF